MENKAYLIFGIGNLHYAIDANLVQEIFLLPELTAVAEAPDDIVGLINLRGKIVPVMHLGLRLRHQIQECCLSDSVIVLNWENLQIGMIVNSVHDVKNINLAAIEEEISYGREEEKSRFTAGIAKVDADIIMLLNHEKLMHYSDTIKDLLPEDTNGNLSQQNGNGKQLKQFQEPKGIRTFSSFYDLCSLNTTLEEKATFRERADNLRQITENADSSGLMPLAVIGLNDEFFGLDLHLVREFTSIRNVTPIPCCPAHIIGNMNLRGEIVTLVDIRNALNMAIATTTNNSKAIVIHVDDLVAGVPVDQVVDVLYLRSSDVKSVPAALHSGGNEYIRGTAPYSEKMLSILDLPKILTNGGLTINEEA